MAEDTGLERTEPASAKRREDAREDGQVAQSHELSKLVLLLSAGGALWFLGLALTDRMSALLRHGLRFDQAVAFDPEQMARRLSQGAADMLWAFAPLFVVLMLAALASSMLLNGWLFSAKPLQPDFGRLDPLAGLARILSWQGVVEMIKALLKTALVGAVAVWVVWSNHGAMLSLVAEPLASAMPHLARLLASSFLAMAASMALIVAIDVPFQFWNHDQKLRMTKEEVRQENKETEGDPHIKAHIRGQQREMARRRMMSEIPKADVVVTNPTHYAVALRYQEGSMRAPRVVAKGAQLLAVRIREIAAEHRVPVLEAPPLARALHRHAEIGDEIPAALYATVAEVLAYVYQLRKHEQGAGPLPKQPALPPLPAGLDPEGAVA